MATTWLFKAKGTESEVKENTSCLVSSDNGTLIVIGYK